MDNLLIEITIVLAIGIALFVAARVSRRVHENKYGVSQRSEKVRFATVLSVTLLVILTITVVWSVSGAILIGVVMLSGFLGILGSKPSLYKDIMYSATISSFIAIFTGWVVHGM